VKHVCNVDCRIETVNWISSCVRQSWFNYWCKTRSLDWWYSCLRI